MMVRLGLSLAVGRRNPGNRLAAGSRSYLGRVAAVHVQGSA